ncbi:MAG: hypothetical protein NVV74_10650 [Magnetospirillum sp.]|nr:hypothetical protein [Magnetospirillum sp.]
MSSPPSTGAEPESGKSLAISLRERLLLNDGWRFHRGDPAGNTANLDYDVRPVVEGHRDDVPADSTPQEAARIASDSQQFLKPWILPTGNGFIGDPAKRYVRPAGDPGRDVPFAHADYDDHAWTSVTLPHDWAIAGPFITTGGGGGMGRLPTAGIGWYRRKLEISAKDAGKKIYLDVEGAMSYAVVWFNGQLVGGWPYGYSSWRVDLTPYAKFGEVNQLAVRLDNPPESQRWYPGAGLYRNVWLTKTQPLHVSQWGTFVTTPEVSREKATIRLEVSIDNHAPAEIRATVVTAIYELDESGRHDARPVANFAPQTVRIAGRGVTTTAAELTLPNPKLWGPPPTQTPHRYVAITEVFDGEVRCDRYETRFGIRELHFDSSLGIQVNGEHVRIKGLIFIMILALWVRRLMCAPPSANWKCCARWAAMRCACRTIRPLRSFSS